MRGVKRILPLYIECQRPGCGKLREVRCPKYQRTQKYCSRRCAAFMNENIRGARLRGVAESARRRRGRAMARVRGLSPIEAFRAGYKRGLYSKLRQIRKRFRLVPLGVGA